MSDLSNFLENELYDHVLRNAAYTPPTTVYLALFTAVSDAEAGSGTEVAASGYARQAVAMGAPTNGAGANTGVITFGPLSGTGTATHAALMDASSSGNALTAIKALAASKAWTDGDSIQFAIGDIDFSLA